MALSGGMLFGTKGLCGSGLPQEPPWAGYFSGFIGCIYTGLAFS